MLSLCLGFALSFVRSSPSDRLCSRDTNSAAGSCVLPIASRPRRGEATAEPDKTMRRRDFPRSIISHHDRDILPPDARPGSGNARVPTAPDTWIDPARSARTHCVIVVAGLARVSARRCVRTTLIDGARDKRGSEWNRAKIGKCVKQ